MPHVSSHPTTRRAPPAGLRIARPAQPVIAWNAWAVVDRANGFHVSRESASGAHHEALTNEVGRTRIFRKRPLAEQACTNANAAAGFAIEAARLAQEPLLQGGAQ